MGHPSERLYSQLRQYQGSNADAVLERPLSESAVVQTTVPERLQPVWSVIVSVMPVLPARKRHTIGV